MQRIIQVIFGGAVVSLLISTGLITLRLGARAYWLQAHNALSPFFVPEHTQLLTMMLIGSIAMAVLSAIFIQPFVTRLAARFGLPCLVYATACYVMSLIFILFTPQNTVL